MATDTKIWALIAISEITENDSMEFQIGLRQ
jgi:hypothetical protein